MSWLNIIKDKLFDNYFCPVCNSRIKYYLPLNNFYIESYHKYGFEYYNKCEMTPIDTYYCPSCGASDRERLYAYYIKQCLNNGKLNNVSVILHFAPEQSLRERFLSKIFSNYITCDIQMENVDYKEDITNLSFSSETFDFLICSHVLEHVIDDITAMKELFRVLKKSGFGIVMVPVAIGLPEILEDSTITSPEERWKYFGQDDHVRLYNRDGFVSRLESVGFNVKLLDIYYFGKDVFKKLGLLKTSVLYVVEKKWV